MNTTQREAVATYIRERIEELGADITTGETSDIEQIINDGNDTGGILFTYEQHERTHSFSDMSTMTLYYSDALGHSIIMDWDAPSSWDTVEEFTEWVIEMNERCIALEKRAGLTVPERDALNALVGYTLESESKSIEEDGCIDDRDSADVPTAELLTVAPNYAYTHARVLSDYLTRTK